MYIAHVEKTDQYPHIQALHRPFVRACYAVRLVGSNFVNR